MLYLVRLKSYKNFDYKVGCTTDINKRFEQYEAATLRAELLATRDGDEYEENVVHRYLHTFTDGRWDFKKDEWYVCSTFDENIISYFKKDYGVMKDRIWEFRDTVLSLTRSLDRDLWSELNKKFVSGIIEGDKNLVPDKSQETDVDTNTKLGQLVDKIESFSEPDDRFKSYCEIRKDHKDDRETTKDLLKYYSGSNFENLYSYFGFGGCRAVDFQISELKRIICDEEGIK